MNSFPPSFPDLLAALEHHAAAIPHNTAFTFLPDDGEPQALTFARLAGLVSRAAARLHDVADRGDRVLLLYPSGLDFVVAFLACLQAGLIAVPSALPHRRRAQARSEQLANDAGARLILTTDPIPEALRSNSKLGTVTTRVVGLSIDTLGEAFEPSSLGSAVDPSGIAFLQYTSGSTSAPRGVAVSHSALRSNLNAIASAFAFTTETVMVTWLPQFHDMGLVGNTLSPIYVGFHVVVLSPHAFLTRPIRWLRAISKFAGTCAGSPNFGWEMCVRTVTEADKASLDLSSLTIAYNGAEPVHAETLHRFAREFAACGFRPEAFFPCYGLAESVLFVTGGPPMRPIRIRHQPVQQNVQPTGALVSCGRSWHDTEIRIVDPDTMVARPAGQAGEIWIRGPSVAAGYWNRPEETRATFEGYVAGEATDGPYLRSGDLGFTYDGELYVTGRIKDVIIIRGRNIYPHDVELAVQARLSFVPPNSVVAIGLESVQDVELCVVLEAKDPPIRRPDGAPDLDAIATLAREAVLQELDVGVDRVVLVNGGGVPRTTSGKVQRALCRNRLLGAELEVIHECTFTTLRR